MSGRIPTRRIGQGAVSSLRRSSRRGRSSPKPTTSASTDLTPATPAEPSQPPSLKARLLKNPFKKPSTTPPNLQNPVLVKMLKRQEAKQNPNRQLSLPPRPKVEHGKLASTSIFDPQREIPGYKDDLTPKQKAAIKARYEEREKQVAMDKDKELSALRLDPDPLGRKTLERELVIKGIRRRGRLTKEQTLKRTERQMLYKSLQLATSTKKLTKLMNMIQGKTVEEALVQLRFNQKRIARDVYKGLLVAQDYAIAERGMGLDGLRKRGEHKTIQAAEGKLQNIARQAKSDPDHVEAHKAALEKAKEAREAAKLALIYPDGTRKLPNVGKPTNILLKDGSRKKVYDPSQIYIDQAWVGKDKTFKTHEFRARGRVNVLRNRTSTFSVVLKEEKTRMRISEELHKKIDNRKLWVALPDRPVTSQRQYCLW